MSENETAYDLKEGHTWFNPETGIRVKKAKKGLRYSVRSGGWGSSIYDLTGVSLAARNNWRNRILSGYNTKVDFSPDEEE